MEIIITEEQHRVILKENFKSDVIKKVELFKQYTVDVVNDLKNSMNFNFRFGVTYGAGIGVVLNHVIEHLHENYSGLSDTDIKMLALTAIMVVFFETKDILKMENEVEKKGLQNELSDAVSFTESLKTKFSKILKAVGSSFWRGTDIIGYAFLLPILGEFTKFLQSYNVSDIDFDAIAKSLSEATGIIVGGHVLKRMFNSLSEKYKN
jgi:hypothetical protein